MIGVLPLKEGRELSAAERRLLEAVGNQAAIAIERLTLADDIDQARLGAERERLRSAMLTSVIARPAHAARLDHRRAVEPQELSRPLRRSRRATSFWARR